jgi:hypothetical protein
MYVCTVCYILCESKEHYWCALPPLTDEMYELCFTRKSVYIYITNTSLMDRYTLHQLTDTLYLCVIEYIHD